MQEERRSGARVRPLRPVLVEYHAFRPYLRDIGIGGAFIDDPRPLPLGHKVQLKVWLDDHAPITVEAVVRRVEDWKGMGVEFLRMSKADSARLRAFLISSTADRQAS